MKKVMNKLIRNEKGQAMPIVLILLLIGGLIIGPLLGFMSAGVKAGQAHERMMERLYAADAGIEDALWKIINDPPGIYPHSYQLTDVNGMSVDVQIDEVTIFYGQEIGAGGVHQDWMTLKSERVLPPYYDAGEGTYIHEWRLKMTNKIKASIMLYEVKIPCPSDLEYYTGLTNEDIAGLAPPPKSDFEDGVLTDEVAGSVRTLTWEFPEPRPEVNAAPDPDNGIYTAVSCTFKLKGPEDAGEILNFFVEAKRQDIGNVWEFKPYKITACADDGSAVVTTVTARALRGAGTAFISYWQIE